MPVEIVIPRLGWSMDEGTFGGWLKKEGDRIVEGDLLYTLEAEKGAQDVESMDAGILRISPQAPQPGDTVSVGQRLGYLLAESEKIDWEADAQAAVRQQAPGSGSGDTSISEPPFRLPDHARTVTHSIPAEQSHPATPRARRAAAALKIDMSNIQGSGRGGRIRERDVLAAAKPFAPEGLPGRFETITPWRRTIAERTLAAVREAAPVTLTMRVDATQWVTLREELKLTLKPVPAYHDILLKLVAHALQQHPRMTAQWTAQGLFLPEPIHIALAVQTEAGLLAPVIQNVPQRSLSEVARETRRLIDLAQRGQLPSADLQDGVFTITNLGAHGIDAFTPILNLPQSAILGVGRIAWEPAVVDGQVVPRRQATLSLTFDHRVHDGTPAAAFLATLRDAIEQPQSILA